ncbi:MAG: heparin lyase I family protein [Thiotrichaceae bacterium]
MTISHLLSGLLLFSMGLLPLSSYGNIFDFDETPLTDGETWLIDFDDHDAGSYSWVQHYSDWSGPKWQMGRNLVTVVEGDEAYSGKSLKLKYKKGVSSCKGRKRCIFWPVNLGAKLDKLYYGYRFKLSEDFDFVKGGKLPGISGGKPSSGGSTPNGKDVWSVRMMWDGKGRLVQYVYHPDQPGKYGDVMFFEGQEPIERGLWHTVQTLVELNTPGEKNGRIVSWLDGKKVLIREDMRFRDIKGLEIDRFQFVSFFGGYGADWAPTKDEFTYIDDIRLSPTPPFYDD